MNGLTRAREPRSTICSRPRTASASKRFTTQARGQAVVFSLVANPLAITAFAPKQRAIDPIQPCRDSVLSSPHRPVNEAATQHAQSQRRAGVAKSLVGGFLSAAQIELAVGLLHGAQG